MHLLDILLPAQEPPVAAVHRLRLLRMARRLPGAQIALGHGLERFQIELPSDGKHGIVRAVVLLAERDERLARDGRNLLLRAQDRARQRMIAEVRLREQIVHQVLRRVLAHGDLLENDAALLFKLRLVHLRIQQQIGQQAHRALQMLGNDLRIIAGAVLCRERVHLAADGVHLHGDFLRRAILRALEKHVLYKVGQAALLLRLVHGARADPQAHAHRREVRDVLCHHAHAI